MSDNPQYSPDQPESKPTAEEHRSTRGGSGGWLLGIILVILGFIFLAQNLTGLPVINNWWALFIMIPAVAAFSAAWRTYQVAGNRLTMPARGSLGAGLLLTLVTAVFLFNLSWTFLGPIVIILAGIGLLLNVFLRG